MGIKVTLSRDDAIRIVSLLLLLLLLLPLSLLCNWIIFSKNFEKEQTKTLSSSCISAAVYNWSRSHSRRLEPDLDSHTENEARDRLLPYLSTHETIFFISLCHKNVSRRRKGYRTLVRTYETCLLSTLKQK